MSSEAQTRPLSRRQIHALHKWPCNGERCWEVAATPFTVKVSSATYSEAYEAIFKSEGGFLAADGKRTFTAKGARRIAALNALYFPRAQQFIGQFYRDKQLMEIAEAEKKKAADEQKAFEDAKADADRQNEAP